MRLIKQHSRFKKDFKKLAKSGHHPNLNELLTEIIFLLANDGAIPKRYLDHALLGEWVGFRECHIKPDLLMIYEKLSDDVLLLVRMGSHSELFD